MRITRRSALILLLLLTQPVTVAAQQAADSAARVDRIFERWNTKESPGCAVGVERDGRTILSRAYGMADLEHDVVNSPATIFEAGSVSKQFTAAAIQLLAMQGELSLDDEVRKHVPELPDYGAPLTIRHMMTHTSGLRDWGSIAGISGWPRGARAHTHAHVLDIVSRQRALNFPSGSEYSYSNTGYNLQAMIVERVSGMPFAEFTRWHLFEPLGMTNTQWRDDYTRIVKGRSVAYSTRDSGFAIDMPFENVHGNGGLLTTVGDLLIWNQNLETGKVGGPGFLEAMHRQMRLSSGRQIAYASGLFVADYNGLREVYHAGATAGYRAFLARYPDQRLSVALLCNVGNANPGGLGRQIADVFLPRRAARAQQAQAPKRVTVPAAELNAKAGLYREVRTGEATRLTLENGTLRVGNAELIPIGRAEFQQGTSGRRFLFERIAAGRERARAISADGDTTLYEPVPEFAPTAEDLAAYVGEYHSPEAEAMLNVVVDEGRLVIRRRPDTRMRLTPLYPDAFDGQLGLIRFLRDPSGRVTELSIRQGRVYDLRFTRLAN